MSDTPPIVIIEWPAPRLGVTGLQGWATCIYDATTGEQIPTITELTLVHSAADDLIYAEGEMLDLEQGRPPLRVKCRFVVAEMRIAPPAGQGRKSIDAIRAEQGLKPWDLPETGVPDFGQMPAGPSH